METLVIFALGAFAIVFTGIVVGLFRVWTSLGKLKQHNQDLYRNMELMEMNYDTRDTRLEHDLQEVKKDADTRVDDVYRYVDSRFDKFEYKINKQLEDK